jgi:hypothetical protein
LLELPPPVDVTPLTNKHFFNSIYESVTQRVPIPSTAMYASCCGIGYRN